MKQFLQQVQNDIELACIESLMEVSPELTSRERAVKVQQMLKDISPDEAAAFYAEGRR